MNQLLQTAADAGSVPLDLYAPIQQDMEEVERLLARILRSSYPRVTEIIHHAHRYRGKRLRPALLLLTAYACGNVVPAHHVLGAVVEMIHTATLVHDDVLDGAAVRRHMSTVNAHWGNQASILLGDFLFTHAFHLAATLDDPRVCRLIGEATNRTCEGELCQGLQQGNLTLTEDEYLDIIDGKTADLISCCCHLGALFSGTTSEVVDCLARYGRFLGIAFQIADDVLDLVGEERATGKSLGTDLAQQKMTLPLIHLRDGLAPAKAAGLQDLLLSPDQGQRAFLRHYLEESDALTYARQRAEDYAAQARAELRDLRPSPYRTILELFTKHVVHRDR